MLKVNFEPYVNGGGAITFVTGIPHTVTWWQIVGYDPELGEGLPHGYLKDEIVQADANGDAVNYWFGPSDPSAAGKIDRIKVRRAA